MMTQDMWIKEKKIVIKAPRKVCVKCQAIKFDKVLDEALAVQAIKMYNTLYGIKGSDIIALRKELNVSQETFGKVLGIAKKTIVAYEHETSVPNASYYTLIKSLLEDKSKFYDFVEVNKERLSPHEIKRILEGKHVFTFDALDPFQYLIEEDSTQYNGYRTSSKERIMDIIQYVASEINGKTRLAKTLFFADAMAYAEEASTLTGLTYAAINNGPIPDGYDVILEYMIRTGKLYQDIIEVNDYTQFNYHPTQQVTLDAQSRIYLDKAMTFTKAKTAAQLSEFTHTLDIWRKTKIGKNMSFNLLDEDFLERLMRAFEPYGQVKKAV